METKEIIKHAQNEDLVNFQKGCTASVMQRLHDRVENYTKYVGYQVTEYFKNKEE